MDSSALALDVGRAFYGNFRQLRPAQRDAVAPVLAGQDVLILAGTGSGKTEAVLAPLVQRWIPAMRKENGCIVIYVTPTRALANDLVRRLEPPLNMLGLIVGVRHGERNDLTRSQKPHLLVTTPESLDVLLTTRNDALGSVRSVVLDEIHLTYNAQRGFQLAVLLKRLQIFVGRPIQVVGLSATVATSSDIWDFFRPGNEVVTVRDDQTKPLDAFIRVVSSPQVLAQLLDQLAATTNMKVLLFANARRECDRLGVVLRGSKSFGENVFVHHSSLDRDARLDVEKRFQEASKAVCIATSTLELGIDIGDIDLVMLYGHPGGWESFLQRVGRGNRRSGKTNVACIVSPDHGSPFRAILAFKALLAQIQSGRLERERPLEIYGAAAQQVLAVISESHGAYQRPSIFTELFSGWAHLGGTVVEDILHELTRSGYLNEHAIQNRYGAGQELHKLRDLRLVWGNFPSRSREVQLMVGGRQIGTIPATNLMRLSPGTCVRFGGRHWCVRRVLRDSIELDPSSNAAALEISYGGTGAAMDPTVVEEMLRAIESGSDDSLLGAEANREFADKVQRMRGYVGWNQLPVAHDSQGHYHFFTFGGRVFNNVIARWAGLGSYKADDIVLRTDQKIDFSRLPSDPRELSDIAALALQVPEELTIFQNILSTELLVRELRDVWLKAPVYRRSLERLKRARISSVALADVAPLCA